MEVPLSALGRQAAEAHLAAITAEHPEGIAEDLLRRELMTRLMSDPAIAADLAGVKLVVDKRHVSVGYRTDSNGKSAIADRLREAGAEVVVLDGTVTGGQKIQEIFVDEISQIQTKQDEEHRRLAVSLLHSTRYLGLPDRQDIRPMPPPLRAAGNRQERRAQERRLRQAAKQATKGAR